MGGTGPRALILDAGALIALERADRRVRALLDVARRERARVIIPAGAVGQVWRDGSTQVTLARLVAHRTTSIPTLDEPTAKAAGALCGRVGSNDVIAASVVLAARAAAPAVVVTSDPGDLLRLDPELHLARL